MVDLPLADRPVNQSVKPCWCRSAERSLCVSEGCHVMFLERRRRELDGFGGGRGVRREGGGEERTYVAISWRERGGGEGQ